MQKTDMRGVVVDRDIPEYTQLYDEVIARAQEKAIPQETAPAPEQPVLETEAEQLSVPEQAGGAAE